MTLSILVNFDTLHEMPVMLSVAMLTVVMLTVVERERGRERERGIEREREKEHAKVKATFLKGGETINNHAGTKTKATSKGSKMYKLHKPSFQL